MTISPKLFKAYDIRGLAPQEIDEDMAYRVGQALVKLTDAKVVVAGQDMRDTSPALFQAFSRGVNSLGADVIDIGLVTTPMFYFAVGEYDLHDAGAMITASHNPKEYNGIKSCYGDVLPIGGNSGMKELRDLSLAGPYPATEEGTVVETDIREAYLERLFGALGEKKIGKLNVVVDCANGMEGVIIKDIFKRLPRVTWSGLYLDLDGSFPNHEANPLKEETLADLMAKVRQKKADVGFSFDGDGDRVGIVDEKGEAVRGDLLVALLAPELLKADPGAAVLFDVRSSLAVEEEVAKAGGRPIMCRVGHGLIKPQMREEKAVFAGELSQHFYFRDFYNAESSDLVMLLVMALISETGKPLSELVAPLKRYFHSGEINSEVADKDAVFARLRETYSHEAATINEIDGLRLDFRDEVRPEGDWWFSVRASNTEPLLRLNLEAKSQAKMEAKKAELLAIIRA